MNAIDYDSGIIGTPIDLSRIIKINKKSIRVKYELQEIGRSDLEEILNQKKIINLRKKIGCEIYVLKRKGGVIKCIFKRKIEEKRRSYKMYF